MVTRSIQGACGRAVALALGASLLSGCGGGSSSPAGGSGGTLTPAPVAVSSPAAPTGLAVTSRDGAIDLSFSAPASTGGGIVDYLASCAAAGAAAVSAANISSPITVAGLTNGVAYSCTVAARNANGAGAASAAITATPGATVPTGPFKGDIVLGAPTSTSVLANVYSPDQSGRVYIAYGTTSGAYAAQTSLKTLSAGQPLEIGLSGLSPDARYYYRLYFTPDGSGAGGPTGEYSFHTPRPAGSTFVFDIQGDSHPEREKTEFNANLYTRTLTTAAADSPDFYLTSGDDFSVDTLDPTKITADAVAQRYRIQRPYLGIIGRQAPVFLVNGNHEQAARYLLDGTPNNVAVWAQNARNSLYSEPAPNDFYTGNTDSVPFIGLLRNYYSWTWGDALFVVIDPYWASSVPIDNVFGGAPKTNDEWAKTHGDAQYAWLKRTLETSKAKYKFVFAHHVMGGGRGGVEIAGLWEWGGKNANGTFGFATQRPTWASPIHQLFVANHVTIFFQGHDHIWAHAVLDGVTYQTLPEAANPFYALLNADAYPSSETVPNTGYARVTVSPANVKVEYVRTYLPADEGPGKKSGTVAYSYLLPAPGAP